MRQSKLHTAAFLGLTSLVIIGSATAIALAWPNARAAAKDQSVKLVGESAKAPLAEAATNYKLATLLDSNNQKAYVSLARARLAAGQPGRAIDALVRAGEGSEAAQLRVRTLLELGRAAEAADRAKVLGRAGRSDADILLAGLIYALAGRSEDIPALLPNVSSPEAAEHLKRIQVGDLPLATELRASGLTESSRTLLINLPTSFERNLTLARIHFDRHSPADLAEAIKYLEPAVAIKPSDIEARRLLAKTYADSERPDDAAAQDILIKRLENQRP